MNERSFIFLYSFSPSLALLPELRLLFNKVDKRDVLESSRNHPLHPYTGPWESCLP